MGKRTVSRHAAFKVSCARQLACAFLFFLTLLFPCVAAARAEGGVKTVDAAGVAVITGGNAALARDSAIGDALRKAVEQAVGTFVSSETMVENYQVLSDNVYTQTHGYVLSYSVTDESRTPAMYEVRLRVEVAAGVLKDDLDAMGFLQKKVEKPRVLFMIAEKNIGHKYYTFWWWGRSEYRGEAVDISAVETALKGLFIKKRFNVVDISGSSKAFEVSDAFRVADLTQQAARSVGKDLNADIVVYGKAVAAEGPRTTGSSVGSYIADVTAQAVRVDDGAVLASATGHGTSRNVSAVSGGTEALSRASEVLGERLIEQITAMWASPQSVTIRVKGLRDYEELTRFMDTLRGRVRGVEAVFQRSFSGGVAVIEVESKVSARQIAGGISRLGDSYRVTSTTMNTVEVTLAAE